MDSCKYGQSWTRVYVTRQRLPGSLVDIVRADGRLIPVRIMCAGVALWRRAPVNVGPVSRYARIARIADWWSVWRDRI